MRKKRDLILSTRHKPIERWGLGRLSSFSEMFSDQDMGPYSRISQVKGRMRSHFEYRKYPKPMQIQNPCKKTLV